MLFIRFVNELQKYMHEDYAMLNEMINMELSTNYENNYLGKI